MGKIIKISHKLWTLSPKKICNFFEENLTILGSPKSELKRINKIPRYTLGKTKILGKEISFVDSASFLFMYKEIFIKQIYKFRNSNRLPFIIDCGANIGLSVIFFKTLFPNSKIIAFEPDPYIFSILQNNVSCYDNIELHQQGVSGTEGTRSFYIEGADGGRIVDSSKITDKIIEVNTTLLSNYLDCSVDFLKIDIEGKEVEVLLESKEFLKNVKNIFVEYHSFAANKQELNLIINVLTETGFRIYFHLPAEIPATPFIRRNYGKDEIDLQLNIFCVRENN